VSPRSSHCSRIVVGHERFVYDDLLDAGGAAWRQLTPAVIKSVCRCPYLERAGQT
jgi:hypothetical protein